MTVYEMAAQYYPRLWDDSRLDQLVAAGRLTEDEAAQLRAASASPADPAS